LSPTTCEQPSTHAQEARASWDSFPPSARRGILEWIANAKRAETREKRIRETVGKASQGIRANEWVPPEKR